MTNTSVLTTLRRSDELEALIAADASRFTVLTGDRPTGPLHLGHYFGTLHNRVRLQQAGARLFVLIADYQVLTDRDVADRLGEHVLGLVADYLSIGIDPATAHDLRAQRRSGAEPAAAAVPVAGVGDRAAAQPDRQGGDQAVQPGRGQRPDADLPGAPGRRHPAV